MEDVKLVTIIELNKGREIILFHSRFCYMLLFNVLKILFAFFLKILTQARHQQRSSLRILNKWILLKKIPCTKMIETTITDISLKLRAFISIYLIYVHCTTPHRCTHGTCCKQPNKDANERHRTYSEYSKQTNSIFLLLAIRANVLSATAYTCAPTHLTILDTETSTHFTPSTYNRRSENVCVWVKKKVAFTLMTNNRSTKCQSH